MARYDRVCLAAIGYGLPPEIVTSGDLERRLAPLYERLKLPEGRLELITGVRERRFWAPGTLPGSISARTGQLALQAAGIDPRHVGALIHGSVCRDHLEPATACSVHHRLGLPDACQIFDVSNACLGLLTGAWQIANMIQLGQISAGLVVGTEGSRQLVETTIEALNADQQLSRQDIKLAIASLTIGSASCAMLLVDRELYPHGSPWLGGAVRANTVYHDLCQSGRDEAAAAGMQPLMRTESERLLLEGVATAAETFDELLTELGWDRSALSKTVCHQVGPAHRRLLFDRLQLDPQIDFPTVEWLGNTGSVALPVTLGRAAQEGHLAAGDTVGLLGIGSGINCVMLGVEWQSCAVLGWDAATDRMIESVDEAGMRAAMPRNG
ncbi:MAG: 3-oxoacyl-ACP synthase III [Pirellulales bacterium]